MATRLEDARIRVILQVMPEDQVSRGTAGPQGGGQADGKGGTGAEGPAIPGVPTEQEKEEKRKDPKPSKHTPRGGPAVMEESGRRGRGILPRVGEGVVQAAGARALRGAPRGTGVLARNLLNVSAKTLGGAGALVAAEEIFRRMGPMISAMVGSAMEEVIGETVGAIPGLGGVKVEALTADITQRGVNQLNKAVLTLPALYRAGGRTFELERARFFLGGPWNEESWLQTFGDEYDIAKQQSRADAAFRAYGGRLMGESIGKEIGRRVKHNASR